MCLPCLEVVATVIPQQWTLPKCTLAWLALTLLKFRHFSLIIKWWSPEFFSDFFTQLHKLSLHFFRKDHPFIYKSKISHLWDGLPDIWRLPATDLDKYQSDNWTLITSKVKELELTLIWEKQITKLLAVQVTKVSGVNQGSWLANPLTPSPADR